MINKNVDISSLKDIFNEYQENYSFVDSDFLKIYSYVTNDKVVAFLLFNVMYEKCEIVDIFVLKEYRNKGIASKLIKEITNDYTVDNITLEVSMLNKKTQKIIVAVIALILVLAMIVPLIVSGLVN